MGFIPLPLAALLIRVVMSSVKVHGALSCTCVFLFYLGLVTLKVLNSIVLLGKSCVYVKRANMEEKLFESSSAASSASAKKPNKADPGRCIQTSGDSKVDPIPASCSPPPPSSYSVTNQPTPRTDLFPPSLADSSPATPASCFPAAEPPSDLEPPAPSLLKEEAAQESSETKHTPPKKDLLEIDRFTICGNRID